MPNQSNIIDRNPVERTLVSGEKVSIRINTIGFSNQTLMRVGAHLVVGAVNDTENVNRWEGIYMWQEVNGVYEYLGDIHFRECDDSMVAWCIYTALGKEDRISPKSAEILRTQARDFDDDQFTGGHASMLSTAV